MGSYERVSAVREPTSLIDFLGKQRAGPAHIGRVDLTTMPDESKKLLMQIAMPPNGETSLFASRLQESASVVGAASVILSDGYLLGSWDLWLRHMVEECLKKCLPDTYKHSIQVNLVMKSLENHLKKNGMMGLTGLSSDVRLILRVLMCDEMPLIFFKLMGIIAKAHDYGKTGVPVPWEGGIFTDNDFELSQSHPSLILILGKAFGLPADVMAIIALHHMLSKGYPKGLGPKILAYLDKPGYRFIEGLLTACDILAAAFDPGRKEHRARQKDLKGCGGDVNILSVKQALEALEIIDPDNMGPSIVSIFHQVHNANGFEALFAC